MNVPIIEVEPDENKHWLIEPHGLEWIFLMRKLINSVKVAKGKLDDRYMMRMRGNDWVYALNPKHYSRELVQRTLGLKPEQLQCGKIVVLNAPKTDGLPEPTVGYFGEA